MDSKVAAKKPSRFKFHPNAKTLAHDTYDKLVPILKNKDPNFSRNLLNVFLSLYLGNHYEVKIAIFGVIRLTQDLDDFERGQLLEELETVFHGNKLSRLCGLINRALILSPVPDQDVLDCLDVMKAPKGKNISKMKVITSIELDEHVTENYLKESLYVPAELIALDKKRMGEWYQYVLEFGIKAAQENPEYGDHTLKRANEWKGKRSARLSYAGRVIYKVSRKVCKDAVYDKVVILRVTSTHDYSVPS